MGPHTLPEAVETHAGSATKGICVHRVNGNKLKKKDSVRALQASGDTQRKKPLTTQEQKAKAQDLADPVS